MTPPNPPKSPSLSVTLTSYGASLGEAEGVQQLLAQARRAEAAGADRLLLTDHVVMGERTDRYPFGPFPFPSDTPWLEPLTLISALAAVTTRIRFSTKILIAPLRPAPLLAKTLATLDVISGGRMEIGVSTGWQREELDACGIDWKRRGQILTDTMAACRVLWRDGPASFHSESVSFDRIWCRPRPLQAGGIPIWFAGSLHTKNLERICRLGDGWIPPPIPRSTLSAGMRRSSATLSPGRIAIPLPSVSRAISRPWPARTVVPIFARVWRPFRIGCGRGRRR